ncbi:MAG: hypothetical protein M3Z41_07270 [Candidatus Eremiobacteraeota bacterium]|nr:hypothetical protein [Candidatus Eremiobacteraeota bacterium]
MPETLYASFADYHNAQQAAGALLDRGLRKEDLSVVVAPTAHDEHSKDVERTAKAGVTTTTGRDAAAGAAKGAGIGAAVGAVALIASLFIPGLGLVTGAGALATALAALVGTTAAGAAVGAIAGYLKDQGVPADVATRYEDAVRHGGAIIAIALPSGTMDRPIAEEILLKYDASDVNSYSPQPLN